MRLLFAATAKECPLQAIEIHRHETKIHVQLEMMVSFVVTKKLGTKCFASPIKNKILLAKATLNSKQLVSRHEKAHQ